MIEPKVTPELISAAAGVLLSLILAYTPKLKQKWFSLDPDYQRLVMLGLLLIVSVGIYLLNCYGLSAFLLACNTQGAWALVKVFVAALIANQSIYPILPGLGKTKAQAKALKDKQVG